MRLLWKVAAPVSGVALLCAAAITWHVHTAKTSELKQAEDVRIFRIRAEQGDLEDQARLGYMYFHGQGVPQDYAEAVNWYHKAADLGYAKAENGLALMYYQGKGTPQDYAEALRWYQRAADQGYASAQDSLGSMYFEGEGVPQNYTVALGWYRRAADQGYAAAQYNLGSMYYHGRGVPQDRTEAIRWYCKAAKRGDEYAKRALGVELTVFGKFALLAQIFAGIWLSLDFLSSSSLVGGKSLRNFRQRVITGTGVLGVFSAGLVWYGYAHNKIRGLSCGLDGFNLFRWLLYGLLFALLVYILRSVKRSGQRTEIGGRSAGSERV